MSLLSRLDKINKEYKAAEKAGKVKTALEKYNELKEGIKTGVNSPKMPRAKPLTKQEITAYADRMAPQVEGKLTRQEKTAKTIAGKTQQQFKKEQTLPVDLELMEGKVDPRTPLPHLTLEQQKGGVLVGLPGDPTLARMRLKGIGDVQFDQPVPLHGGPRYGDDEKLWASNLSAASNFMNLSQRASQQYGGAPVYGAYMKMPEGFGFAQHYLDSLLQYQRPHLLPEDKLAALNDEIRRGYVDSKGRRVTFDEFAGFENPLELQRQTLADSNLRTHIADRLEKSKKAYGLLPAEDVRFAVSHPELTNLETGASGFTVGKVNHLDPLTESSHPTYSNDIGGEVVGQFQYSSPYDLLYRDQLQLIKKNPIAPEFNTLKMLGARQQIDEQLVNELNEYQERMRNIIGKKKGGAVLMQDGGAVMMGIGGWAKAAKELEEAMTKLPKGTKTAQSKIEKEFAEEQARKAALYAGHTPPTETGKQALAQAKKALEPSKPLTKKQFQNQYAQHIDIRGREGTAEENAKSIMENGFRRGMNVNAFPPYSGMPPTDVMSAKFQPQAGDVVYLAPKGQWSMKPNGMQINEGWKPQPHEVVRVTDPNMSMYEHYLAAQKQGATTAPEQIVNSFDSEMMELNKQKFREPSKVKQRLYHGTGSDISEFRPNSFFSDDPRIAEMYAKSQHRAVEGSGPNIIPVDVQFENPYFHDENEARKQGKNFSQIIAPDASAKGRLQEALRILREKGHDSVILQNFDDIGGRQNQYIALDPSKVKSAIGNQGTYDITNPDITKARGGLVHMAHGGIAHMADGGQEFPLNTAPVVRNRAGQIVENPNDIITGLWDAAAGFARGNVLGALATPGDILRRDSSDPIIGLSEQQRLDNQNPFKFKPQTNPMYAMPAASQVKQRQIVPSKYLPDVSMLPNSEELEKILPSAGNSEAARVGQIAGEVLSPFDVIQAPNLIVRGAKAVAPVVKKAATEIAPRAVNLAEEYAARTQMGMPFEMSAVPMDEAARAAHSAAMREKYAAKNAAKATVEKAPEVKAPANDLGFYSAVEKASLNLQRKSGNGDAFISDLLKNPDVSPAKLEETGLLDALKGRTGVTRDEVQQLAAEGKIPLQERVAKEFSEEPKSWQEHRDNVDRVNNKLTFYGRSIDDLKSNLDRTVKMHGDDSVIASQLRDKIKVMEDAYKQTYDELNKLNSIDLEASAAKYGPTSHPSLNTRGGENYREILIKTPENVAKPTDTSGWKVVTDDENKYSGQRAISIFDGEGNLVAKRSGYRGSDYDAINNAAKTEQKYESSKMNFDGSHHDDPNILMHLRVADHVDTEGKKGLLIDELQSDWHQKGRDKGYGKKLVDMPAMSADELYDKHFNELSPAQKEYLQGFMNKWESAEYSGGDEELNKLINQYENWTSKQTIGSGIPDAPFKEDWYQLGLKRAIKEATDSGMDRVYLTTGKTQADRYDLSKQVKYVEVEKTKDGQYRVYALDKHSEPALDQTYPKDKLSEVIGKELAEKAVNQIGDTGSKAQFKGVDLQVGGEGMKQWYDKNYLNWLKKYANEHGATVGTTKLPSAYRTKADLSGIDMHHMEADPEFKKILDEEFAKMDPNNPSINKPWDAALKRFGGQEVYYLELNPKLKKSAQKGQSYADGGSVHWIDHLKNQLAGGGQPEANDEDWIDQLRSQLTAEVKKEMGSTKAPYNSEARDSSVSERRGVSPRLQGFGFPTGVDIARPYPIVEGAHLRGMVDVPMDSATLSLGASSNVINTPEALFFTPPSGHMEAKMPIGKGEFTLSGMKTPKFGNKDIRLMYQQQFAAGGLAK